MKSWDSEMYMKNVFSKWHDFYWRLCLPRFSHLMLYEDDKSFTHPQEVNVKEIDEH